MIEKEQLHNFIVNNHNLELLESKINFFNPFNVLKIAEFEIRHSNVLAWFLNPNENHGLNDYFLKKVISQIVLENEEVIDEKINLIDIHLANFSDSIVKREKNNIDILLLSKKNKFALLIENKIHSKESKLQLTKYLNYVNENYHNFKLLPVLLTKTGDEPENNENYAVFSHESIYKLIQDILSLKTDNLSNEVISFIKFYLLTLRKILGMDKDLKELSLKIYNEHKEAIDYINSIIGQEGSSLYSAFKSFEVAHNELKVFVTTNNWMWFLTNNLLQKLPKIDSAWIIPYPMALWISKGGKKNITFHIEIGAWEVAEERLAFITYLEKVGYKIRSTAKRLESKYSRIITESYKIKDWGDEEELLEAIEKLYLKCEKEIERIQNAVINFDLNV